MANNEDCQGKFYGVYKGKIVDVQDPKKMKRATVRVPAISSGNMEWALPSQSQQEFVMPNVGDAVWIMFQGGDIKLPVWFPGWNYEGQIDEFVQLNYPTNNPEQPTGARIIKHGKHLIFIGNNKGVEFVQIGDENLRNSVKVVGSEEDPKIIIETKGNISIDAEGAIEQTCSSYKKEVRGKDREVTIGIKEIITGEKLTLTGVTEVEVSSQGDIKIITMETADIKLVAGSTPATEKGLVTSEAETVIKHPIKNNLTAPTNELTGTTQNKLSAPSNELKGTTQNKLSAPVNELAGETQNKINAPQNLLGTGVLVNPVVKGVELGAYLQALIVLIQTWIPTSAAPGSPTVPNPAQVAALQALSSQIAGAVAPFNSVKNWTE